MTNILVAYDQQRAIGARGDLPWGRSLPGDLAMFKQLTLDKTVIMGRKTFESIGRPLPKRENIVISRDPTIDIEGVICVNNLVAALGTASKEAFVIGGGQLYEAALPVTDTIYATEVHATFPEADTFFPYINHEQWQEYYRVHNTRPVSGDAYDYDFVRYDRIK